MVMKKQNIYLLFLLFLIVLVSIFFYLRNKIRFNYYLKNNYVVNNNENLEDIEANRYKLAKLPYAYNDLEPYIDAKTMEIHYTKHYQAYADGLNKVLENHKDYMGKPIEWLIENLDSLPELIRTGVEDYGGGYLNHTLFWFMMSPNGGGAPQAELKDAINKYFGSFESFKEKFSEVAKKLFGSGWAWLCVAKDKKLVIVPTKDQDNPLTQGYTPILGLDVWEHAYYLKYQNKRFDYIQAWWHVVNWRYVENKYREALSK